MADSSSARPESLEHRSELYRNVMALLLDYAHEERTVDPELMNSISQAIISCEMIVPPENIGGIAEVAQRVGASKQAVSERHKHGKLPGHIGDVAATPLFDLSKIIS